MNRRRKTKEDSSADEKSYASETKRSMTTRTMSAAAAQVEARREECSICLCELADKKESIKELDKCKHKFHTDCINEWLNTKASCPICQMRHGPPKGNQPPGTMTVNVVPQGSVAGFPGSKGCIQITYNIPSGIQGREHPNPGVPFSGTCRHAYLPNNADGNKIAKLLRVAFDSKLIFTVGTSLTTGVQNTVVWNNIHHKTTLNGGEFGYPDATYLERVEDELRAAGVDETMLK